MIGESVAAIKDEGRILLAEKVDRLADKLKTYIMSADEKTAHLYMDWLLKKTDLVSQEDDYLAGEMPYLSRGDVVNIDLGFNIGEEFGGDHWGIVLLNSSTRNSRAVILPITSQEPPDITNPIYVKIGVIVGMVHTEDHWTNIFNVQSLSKQRLKMPLNVKRVSGKVLDRISMAIVNQIALKGREFDELRKLASSAKKPEKPN